MKRIMVAFALGFACSITISAFTEQKLQVDADKFDGGKFMGRNPGLTIEDFHAEYDKDGKMWVVIHDNAAMTDQTPIFESPDTTKRDRLSALRSKMGRLEDFTVSEINEYLRLQAGL